MAHYLKNNFVFRFRFRFEGKCGLLKKPLQKIVTGGVLVGFAFVAAAILESKIQETRDDQYYKTIIEPQPVWPDISKF